MLLHTPGYLLFLLIICLIYRFLNQDHQRRNFLLFTSYLFYAAFDVRFLGILFGLTITTYWLGRKIPNNPYAWRYALLNILINLGVLGFFKYANFFLENVSVLGQWLNLPLATPGLSLLLPIGISFYSFQSISYTTEIYRQKLKPVDNFISFALYLAFFPKLIAGPFVRPSHFLDQISVPKLPGKKATSEALQLLLLGLFKKVVIADALASMADVAFRAANQTDAAGSFPTPLFIQGFYLYAIQIYADFGGYTDISRASAMLLGFSLPENFKQPYLAETISSFWNRWHMSLTQWFREYIFFPTTRALLIKTERKYPTTVQIGANVFTMILIGFWHGASWTFILWGVWHAIWLTIERWFNFKPTGTWKKLASGFVTFHLVGIGWILFRAESFATALHFLRGFFSFEGMTNWPIFFIPALPAIFLSFVIDFATQNPLENRFKFYKYLRPAMITASCITISLVWLLQYARGDGSLPFIYGQF